MLEDTLSIVAIIGDQFCCLFRHANNKDHFLFPINNPAFVSQFNHCEKLYNSFSGVSILAQNQDLRAPSYTY